MNNQSLISSFGDALWSFDFLANRFTYINEKLGELYEISLKDIKHTPSFYLQYVHPDDSDYVLEKKLDYPMGRPKDEVEYRILINGRVKWVSDKRYYQFDENLKIQSVTGILSDITSRENRSGHQVIDSFDRYLFSENPNPLWIYDKQSLRFLAVNHAAISKYGYSESEFLNMTIAEIRPAEDIPGLKRKVKNVKNEFLNSKRYWKHLKKDGKYIYVNISGHGITYKGFDAEIILAHDITVEVETRNKITLAKENLDTLINNISDVIWSIDTDYRLISANISFRNSVFLTTGKKIKMGDSVFVQQYPDATVTEWKNYYDKALKGESVIFTEIASLANKMPIYIETKMNPVKKGIKILGVACISTNIQQRMEEHNLVLEQNKKLREVISLASHEIRGPVATLLSLSSAFNLSDLNDPFNVEILEHVRGVTQGLDSVLHRLVEKGISLKDDRQSHK